MRSHVSHAETWFCWFQCWKNSIYFSWPIYVKKNGFFPREKSFFKILGLSFSSKLVWDFRILLLKLLPRKLKPWFVLWSFFFLQVALYLYKSIIPPCMEYCHAWTDALSYYLLMLDKLQKQLCRTVDPPFAASPENLAHSWKVASLIKSFL